MLSFLKRLKPNNGEDLIVLIAFTCLMVLVICATMLAVHGTFGILLGGCQ
jgi:hypothetical protein